ncbi:hypothetical protein ACH9L7_02155 [Haloferax sp. S1W]|uniref:hypothetical protein n=1 Tax=Haloferax sp. S1W TaxID=3377110 RepID=UPI0037C5D365
MTDSDDDRSADNEDARHPADDTSEEWDGPQTDDSQTDGPDRTEPLSDIASRVAERRAHASVRGDDEDELFEAVSVDELDGEDVWTSLVEETKEEDPDMGVGIGASAEPVDEHGTASEHVVPKTEFCQRCEYFSNPPEFACTYAGTTIVEMPDSEHFRVRDCPMVDDDD